MDISKPPVFESDWDVPTYRIDYELAPVCKWAVCVFVLNEGERIRNQLFGMKSMNSLYDLYVCDGGSTDGSLDWNLMDQVGARGLLVKTSEGKLSAQMRMGLAHALVRGHDGVVVIDGNGKDDFNRIPSFLEALADGFDHLQGSRYISGGKGVNTPFLRHLGVRVLHAPLISFASKFRYTDTTNGFRAYSRRFLLDSSVLPFRSVFSGYELHYYLAIRAGQLGFSCKEIPVTRSYPKAGRVPTKISPFRGNLLILRTLWWAVRGRFDP